MSPILDETDNLILGYCCMSITSFGRKERIALQLTCPSWCHIVMHTRTKRVWCQGILQMLSNILMKSILHTLYVYVLLMPFQLSMQSWLNLSFHEKRFSFFHICLRFLKKKMLFQKIRRSWKIFVYKRYTFYKNNVCV